MGGQPISVGVDADDDERAAALLALEPWQRRVDRAAFRAAAGRGFHVAGDAGGRAEICPGSGGIRGSARATWPAEREREIRGGVFGQARSNDTEDDTHHHWEEEGERGHDGLLGWAEECALC